MLVTPTSRHLVGRRGRPLPATILFATWLTMLLGGTGAIDHQLYRALYVGGEPGVVSIARTLTFLGEPWVVVTLAIAGAIGLWWVGRARDGVALLAITLIGRSLSVLLKLLILRPRPDLLAHLVNVKTSSFPSGHTTAATIFYVSLPLVLLRGTAHARTWAIAGFILAVGVGMSRVMLGVHWPSDVIGGWTFGLFWVLLAMPVAEHWRGQPVRR